MDNINLKSNAPKNVINVTSDSTIYYANVAKEAANSATQSAQLATEKAQIVQNGVQTSLNAINELKTSSLSSIETLADSSTSEISALKTTSLTEMTSAKTTALETIGQAKTAALTLIENSCGNFADKDLSNITDDGKDVIRTLASGSGSSSSGGGSWGSITGSLSDQTDLAEALASKLNVGYTNSNIPYVVETGEDISGYRYRRWSDGFLEQMGSFGIGENLSGWILFPFSYESTTYSCIVASHYTGLRYSSSTSDSEKKAYGAWTYQKQTTKCGVTNYGPSGELYWYAFGKGANT